MWPCEKNNLALDQEITLCRTSRKAGREVTQVGGTHFSCPSCSPPLYCLEMDVMAGVSVPILAHVMVLR